MSVSIVLKSDKFSPAERVGCAMRKHATLHLSRQSTRLAPLYALARLEWGGPGQGIDEAGSALDAGSRQRG
jgi:hypothetical protein